MPTLTPISRPAGHTVAAAVIATRDGPATIDQTPNEGTSGPRSPTKVAARSLLAVGGAENPEDVAVLITAAVRSGRYEIEAIYSPQKMIAESLVRPIHTLLVSTKPILLFHGEGSNGCSKRPRSPKTALENDCIGEVESKFCGKDFRALVDIPDIDTVLIAMDEVEQVPLLNALMANPKFSRNILSLTLPSTNTQTLGKLLANYKKWTVQVSEHLPPDSRLPPLWGVATPGRFETVLNKLIRIQSDVGEILACTLALTSPIVDLDSELEGTPANQTAAVSEVTTARRQIALLLTSHQFDSPSARGAAVKSRRQLLRSLAFAASIIRKLFGSIKVLTGMTSQDGEIFKAATMLLVCEGNNHITVDYAQSCDPRFELILWGTFGRIVVRWRLDVSLFECKRELSHFEHPSLMPATGAEWSTSVFYELQQCLMNDPHVSEEELVRRNHLLETQQGVSPWEAWTDIATAEACITSKGGPVTFTPVYAQ